MLKLFGLSLAFFFLLGCATMNQDPWSVQLDKLSTAQLRQAHQYQILHLRRQSSHRQTLEDSIVNIFDMTDAWHLETDAALRRRGIEPNCGY